MIGTHHQVHVNIILIKSNQLIEICGGQEIYHQLERITTRGRIILYQYHLNQLFNKIIYVNDHLRFADTN